MLRLRYPPTPVPPPLSLCLSVVSFAPSSSFRPSPPSSSSFSLSPSRGELYPYLAPRVSSSSVDMRASFFRFSSCAPLNPVLSLPTSYRRTLLPAYGKPRCLFLSFCPVPPLPSLPPRRAHSHFLSSSHTPPHSSLLPQPTHLFTRQLSHSFPYE